MRTHEVVLIDGLVYVYESTGTAEEVDSTGVATEVVGAVPEEAR
ncbi:3-phenylpropionate dioxygenase [Saccharomonospora viridis]|uniref:3-phenylpropionate dioxygenase n=1 Tax=Saccharomonospora viridis TaxID=1852 RepID=A0A837D5S6_9PSEU|nr:3-phenylpropionate dioxygenase [Saccharomonospora viridis]